MNIRLDVTATTDNDVIHFTYVDAPRFLVNGRFASPPVTPKGRH
jgi:hypothetical protein